MGHSAARKNAEGPAPSPLFVWVYLGKGQDTTILVLGYGVGEKSYSPADSIRFNFSEEGAGMAATGSRIGGPGFYACDVQPGLGRLLLHLKPFLKRPTDQLHHP